MLVTATRGDFAAGDTSVGFGPNSALDGTAVALEARRDSGVPAPRRAAGSAWRATGVDDPASAAVSWW